MQIKENPNILITWILVLTLFWSGFWLLNGLDKFYNGTFEPMLNPGVTKGVIVDVSSGDVKYALQPMHTTGLFGVNRNTKTGIFFTRIGLEPKLADQFLTVTGIVETLLGLLFIYALIEFLRKKYTTRCVSIGLLLSMLIFTGFSFGDILFGERMELWEHSTFIIVIMGSYYMYNHLIGELKK